MEIFIGADKIHSKFNIRSIFIELNEPQNQYIYSFQADGLGFDQIWPGD